MIVEFDAMFDLLRPNFHIAEEPALHDFDEGFGPNVQRGGGTVRNEKIQTGSFTPFSNAIPAPHTK